MAAWVAATPSDDDDEEYMQPRRFPVPPSAEAEFYVAEDDDVQVVNVMKHEIQQQRVAEGAGQYVPAGPFSIGSLDLPQTRIRVDDGGDVHCFPVAATSRRLHQHIDVSISTSQRRRKKKETRKQKKIRQAAKFDVQNGRRVDEGLCNAVMRSQPRSEGVFGGDPASQFRVRGIMAGGPVPLWREQGTLVGGSAPQFMRPGLLGRGPTLAESMLRDHNSRRQSVDECYNNVSRPQLREHGVLGGGPASQVRERGIFAGGYALQLREQGLLVPESEPVFASTDRERLLASHGRNRGRFVDHEHILNNAVGTAELRVEGHQGRVPGTTPCSSERMVSGNTMSEWWSSFRVNAGTNFSRLHGDIVSFCKTYELTPDQMQVRREALEYVEHIVHEIWPTAEVQLFGSTATGLALPWSDIDVAVMSADQNGSGQKSATISCLSALGKHLKRHGQCQSLRQISHAKVPLLKVVFKSGLACDISFDVQSGPRGVPVILRFMQQHEALRPLCLVLKFFLGQQNLNELYTGGLGSFCLINMVVSHLQMLGVNGGGYDLGALLLSFFTRYSTMHNYTTDVVSTRVGCCASKQAKGWVNSKYPELLAVEDPLDPTSDIAKGSYRIQDIRAKFLNAQNLLLSHWHRENVLAQLVDTTGNPNHRPKFQVEKSQVTKQPHEKKRRKLDSVRSGEGKTQSSQKQKKHKVHYKQRGTGVVGRKFTNSKKNLKKEKRAAGKELQVERILTEFWDSHLSPSLKSRSGAKRRVSW